MDSVPWSSIAEVSTNGHDPFVAIALEIYPQVAVDADAGPF